MLLNFNYYETFFFSSGALMKISRKTAYKYFATDKRIFDQKLFTNVLNNTQHERENELFETSV